MRAHSPATAGAAATSGATKTSRATIASPSWARRAAAIAIGCASLCLPAISPAWASPEVPAPPPASASGAKPSWHTQAPVAPATAGPLLAEAQQIYRSMTQTQYSHQYRIEPKVGRYVWDCIGFAGWAMRQATPNAWQAFHTATGVAQGAAGHVGTWATFLSGNPGPSWQVLSAVTDLQGGELMVIPGEVVIGGKVQYGSAEGAVQYSGHVVIIAGPPLPLADGSYAVFVYDSTALPGHGAYDSRYTDPRALPLAGSTNRKSGTGYGTMRLTVDTSGRPTGVYWSSSTKRPIAFQGQPVLPILARPLN